MVENQKHVRVVARAYDFIVTVLLTLPFLHEQNAHRFTQSINTEHIAKTKYSSNNIFDQLL